MKSLDELRADIDAIDMELIQILEKRFNVVLKIKNYKEKESLIIEDLKRENKIINRIEKQLNDSQYRESIKSIYKSIFIESKKLQR